MFWFSSEADVPWLHVEKLTAKGLSLDSFLYSAPLKELKKRSDNPFVKNTIVIWYEAHKYLRDLPVLSRFSPIWGNDNFSPAKKDMGFKMWMNKGMIRIKDVYEDNILQSFESLVVKFHIPQKHFFKYLQLRSFITTCLKGSTQLPPLSILENCTLQDCYSKGWITQLYNILRSNQKDCSEIKDKHGSKI